MHVISCSRLIFLRVQRSRINVRSWGGEPGDEATFLLKTPYLLLHVPVRPQEVKSNAVYCTQHTCVIILYIYMYMYVYTCPTSVHVSPHDTYILYMCIWISKLSLQLSVVAFSFSHVHFSPHISFITTFTSKMTGGKFPHSLYCSWTCDAITCGHFSLASSQALLYMHVIIARVNHWPPLKNKQMEKQTCTWHVHCV
jgi:hypothetical protein